jgi:hypothetical protein
MNIFTSLNYKKNFSLLVFIGFLFISCNSSEKLENTKIKFDNETYEFGEIPYGKDASKSINFKNVGKYPLQIEKIKSSCGCTVLRFEQKKIEPNHFGEFEVFYDANAIGRFKKSIYVYYNGLDSPSKITITGEVEYLSLLK